MAGDEQTRRLVITWHPTADADPRLLAGLAATFAALPADDIRIVRACRACGSDRHGQPRVLAPDGTGPLHASISHSGGRTVAAVTDAGPVGIDVEAISPSAHAPTTDELTTWVRKESLVKATGHGLSIDPTLIAVSPPSSPPSLLRWPAPEPIGSDAWMLDLESPPGFVTAVTVLADARPRLITAWGAPGA